MAFIEFAPSFRKRPIRHVLMDWDGTTSYSRSGWAEVMTDVYAENLPPLDNEDVQRRRQYSWDELMPLNGKPAIHQMMHLTTLIEKRGGKSETAAVYQSEFQRRLSELVHTRMEVVRSRPGNTDAFLVKGVRQFLEMLQTRNIGVTLATGTPLPQVLEEAALFDIERYFNGIYGPQDLDDRTFSKRAVIQKILTENQIDGSALIAFGDGPAELIETKAVGGLAVALATDEAKLGSGKVDEWKRSTLLAAGADAVIADFSQATGLADQLLE